MAQVSNSIVVGCENGFAQRDQVVATSDVIQGAVDGEHGQHLPRLERFEVRPAAAGCASAAA
jgi:hypothetical protein